LKETTNYPCHHPRILLLPLHPFFFLPPSIAPEQDPTTSPTGLTSCRRHPRLAALSCAPSRPTLLESLPPPCRTPLYTPPPISPVFNDLPSHQNPKSISSRVPQRPKRPKRHRIKLGGRVLLVPRLGDIISELRPQTRPKLVFTLKYSLFAFSLHKLIHNWEHDFSQTKT
jgi:hypothetical protein